MTDKETIILDLTATGKDSGSKDNSKLRLIQYEAFKKICDDINKRVEYYANPTRQKELSDFNDDARGTVFFIDGTRGAGKTTFLKSVTKKLTTHNDENKLGLLIEIDPTQVETGEHIFLSVLYALKHLIDKQNLCRQFSIDEDKYEGWRKQFKKLAGGLQLLDEKNNPLQGIDEEAFLNWGLERAQSGMELAVTFKKLIEDSCALLKKDALIISIDDADTNFSKGKQVLEMIRRYLDSPYLVVLITGDLQLYSHLVRDHYYESMGKTIYERDKHRSDEQIRLIDHLEDQYLKKLFPLHQRTHLTPLWDLMKSPKYVYKVQYAGASNPKPLDEIINQLLKEGLYIKGERDLSLYREFLLKQPLRSVTQLLKFCTQNMEKGLNIEERHFSPKDVVKGFRAMFRGSLHSHQIDVNALSAGDINALNDAVFRVVLEDGEFDTGSYLRPQPSKESLRNCFVALAAEVASHCEVRPDYAIDYMLQAQGSITLYNLILGDTWNKLNDMQREQRFRSYFSIGRNENTLNWARHACGVLAGTSNTRSMRNAVRSSPNTIGSVLAGASNTRSIRNGVIGLARSGLYTAESIISNTLKEGDIPIFAFSMVNIADGDTKTYASIFNILGIIVRLLSLKIDFQDTDSAQLIITSELRQHMYVSTISRPSWNEGIHHEEDGNQSDYSTPHSSEPSWSEGIHHEEDGNQSDYSTPHSSERGLESLVHNIIAWLEFSKNLKNEMRPSSVFLGKVWTRLYFSLLSISDKQLRSEQENGPATIMELYAVCLINAFFVEERYYHHGTNSQSKIDRTNPLHSSAENFLSAKFGDNKIKEIDIEQYPLTRLITTCPLTLGLMQQQNVKILSNAMLVRTDASAEATLKEIIDQNNESIFEKLDNITIAKYETISTDQIRHISVTNNISNNGGDSVGIHNKL